ncbi:uncharacterized protein LOC117334463 isoform X2 [Pecten maximus]|uniref:uncharacterized protein LOC117334463 isoform X2 n=1 Tax=Pecten maximus TaxID=6579 RepID=UPI001458D5A5|nr:uncharacterized protein LOC117334463 isoform X2 [Pecten maximus]
MNGLTLAVIVTLCVGATFATSYRTQDDDWSLFPHGSVRNGHLVTGYSGVVRNGFVGSRSVHPGYVRNGFLGVGQVGNAYVGSGLSRVLGHRDTVMYPTHDQHSGRRYRRSTGDYSTSTFDAYRRYPDVYPRNPDVYPRYPSRYPGRPVYGQRVAY